MTTLIYIAGPFSWREQLDAVAQHLDQYDIGVTSRWLTMHAEHGDDMDAYSESDLMRYGLEDLQDIEAADVMVVFNNSKASGGGGRWVEMGYAISKAKPVLLFGERTNPFCYQVNWGGEMPSLLDDLSNAQPMDKTPELFGNLIKSGIAGLNRQ